MDILIKSAKVIDPNSPYNQKKVDILIQKGKIVQVGKTLNPKGKVKEYKHNNLHVSPGWFDMNVHFRDPGFEYKEDIMTGTSAAAFGGFTGVACRPDTNPPIHTKSEVEYIKNKSAKLPIDVYPIASLSKNMKGEEMSEMFDMKQEGAIAFSDGKRAIANPQLLSISLLYSKGIDALIMTFPNEEEISQRGKMNEGEVSTTLGLKGIPALAEELHVVRNIFLAEYHDARVHFSTISTAKSVELIRQAKKKGIKVTAEVAVHNLIFEDSNLSDFDTNYKLNPPLRAKADINALVKGLKDGTIDAISTDHSPEDEENKKVEFDNAEFGIIGLETAFASLNTSLGHKLELLDLVNKLSVQPRKILDLPELKVEEGSSANLTLFDPTLEWTFEKKGIRSKSQNTPFIGTNFKGKVLAICNRGFFQEA